MIEYRAEARAYTFTFYILFNLIRSAPGDVKLEQKRYVISVCLLNALGKETVAWSLRERKRKKAVSKIEFTSRNIP